MKWDKLVEWRRDGRKWRVFWYGLLAIGVIGTALSLVARVAFIRDDPATRPRLAVVTPMGDGAGAALRNGVTLYVDALNRQGGYGGRRLELLAVDETAQAAATIVADDRVVGVVGYLDPQLLRLAGPAFAGKSLPVATPLPLPHTATHTTAGVTWLGLDPRDQARFVANYARNIQMRRIMYVIREEGPDFDPLVEPFVATYQRFATPVRKTWVVAAGPDTEASVADIFEELKTIDIGAVYLATGPDLAARLVKGIRESGSPLDIYGPATLATTAFNKAMGALSGKQASIHRHGIVAATPMLFDTANEEAQQFQTRYQQTFDASPDWLATTAHDAAKVVVSASPGARDTEGIMGTLSFAAHSAQLPIQIGVYNGDQMISAPVQLLPIAKGADFNYIEALRNGRVLYVNDRFMFKTSVVYVGVTLNEVADLDLQKEIATLDLSIWFRLSFARTWSLVRSRGCGRGNRA